MFFNMAADTWQTGCKDKVIECVSNTCHVQIATEISMGDSNPSSWYYFSCIHPLFILVTPGIESVFILSSALLPSEVSLFECKDSELLIHKKPIVWQWEKNHLSMSLVFPCLEDFFE